ncbi:MAG TPA: hypothetical protein VGI50_12975 [Solirubrobacteraceae bacterium]
MPTIGPTPFPTPGPGRYGAPWPDASTTPAGKLLAAPVVVAGLVLVVAVALAALVLVVLLLELLPQPAARTAAHSSPAVAA